MGGQDTGMSRRKWIVRNGKTIEVDPKTYRPVDRHIFSGIIPDSKPFETIDGDYIGGRAQLREHEKRTGTYQVGNELKQPVSHETAVRQTKENLLKEYRDANIPVRFNNAQWQEYKDK